MKCTPAAKILVTPMAGSWHFLWHLPTMKLYNEIIHYNFTHWITRLAVGVWVVAPCKHSLAMCHRLSVLSPVSAYSCCIECVAWTFQSRTKCNIIIILINNNHMWKLWMYGSVYMDVRVCHSAFVVPFYLPVCVTSVSLSYLSFMSALRHKLVNLWNFWW